MSNGYDWDDADEGHETPAMRVLREKAEADSALIREMRDELAAMRTERERVALEEGLKAKGLDPKVADLIPKGTDPEKFLADYGSLLAKKVEAAAEADAETDGSEGDGVPSDEAAAQAAISGAASGAQPKAGLDATEAKIKEFDNADDLLAYLQSQ